MAAVFLRRPAPGCGYEWSGDSDPHLRERPGFFPRPYDPLAEAPQLYLEFARLADRDGVLAFADRYGLLELHRKENRKERIKGPDRPETLQEWLRESSEMADLVELWAAVNRRDVGWLQANRIRYNIHAIPASGPLQPLRPDVLESLAGGALDMSVSAKLMEAEVHPCLERKQPPPKGPAPRPQLSVRYLSLLGAMYWQFAEDMLGGSEPRRCARCGAWFKVAGGRRARAHRDDKQTCSAVCRVAMFRERKGRALAMREQGNSPREIARALRTEVETVKGWLAKRKG
jgi:hypothetical protein